MKNKQNLHKTALATSQAMSLVAGTENPGLLHGAVIQCLWETAEKPEWLREESVR